MCAEDVNMIVYCSLLVLGRTKCKYFSSDVMYLQLFTETTDTQYWQLALSFCQHISCHNTFIYSFDSSKMCVFVT